MFKSFILLILFIIKPIYSIFSDNGFDQSIAYKYLPAFEKKQLQKQMLNLLGLNHRPMPKHISAPNYLKDLYQSYLDEDTANLIENKSRPVIIEGEVLSKSSLSAINDSDVIISFVNQYDQKLNQFQHHKEKDFWFDVSKVLENKNLMGSELRIFRNSSNFPARSTQTFKLSVYSNINQENDKKLKLLDSKIIGTDKGWLMFNVTEAMLDWVSYPDCNYGLHLSIVSLESNLEMNAQEIGLVVSNGPKEKQPFLLAYFKENQEIKIERLKRDTHRRHWSEATLYESYNNNYNPYLNPEQRYSSTRSCQKRNLYVSFKDLGWQDWIIAPEGYPAFFCYGECSFPLNAHMNATNHAIVQTLVHLMNPSDVPKPCCAPTKLSSIMVLYFDDNSNVILKKYKNMVVKSCGCH